MPTFRIGRWVSSVYVLLFELEINTYYSGICLAYCQTSRLSSGFQRIISNISQQAVTQHILWSHRRRTYDWDIVQYNVEVGGTFCQVVRNLPRDLREEQQRHYANTRAHHGQQYQWPCVRTMGKQNGRSHRCSLTECACFIGSNATQRNVNAIFCVVWCPLSWFRGWNEAMGSASSDRPPPAENHAHANSHTQKKRQHQFLP